MEISRRAFALSTVCAPLVSPSKNPLRDHMMQCCAQTAITPSPATPLANFPGDQLPQRLLASDTAYRWDQLKLAYSLWYQLPASDPRGPCYQRDLHNRACFVLGVHEDWRFLFWHRAFLYFHERILTGLLRENPAFTGVFRLPVWNWDEQHYVPDGYLKLLDEFPPAYPCPCLTALGCGTDTEFSADEFSAWLRTDDSQNFLEGNKSTAPNASLRFHWKIHLTEGYMPAAQGDIGLMDDLKIAAYDPLFYSHHANVDRFFEAWKVLYPSYWKAFKDQPPEGSFNFIDGDGSSQSVTVRQLLFDEPYALPQYLSKVSVSDGTPLQPGSKQHYAMSVPTKKLATQPGSYLLRYVLQESSVDIGRFDVLAGGAMPQMNKEPVSSFLVSPQIAVSIGHPDSKVRRFEIVPLKSPAKSFPSRLHRKDFSVETLVLSKGGLPL